MGQGKCDKYRSERILNRRENVLKKTFKDSYISPLFRNIKVKYQKKQVKDQNGEKTALIRGKNFQLILMICVLI